VTNLRTVQLRNPLSGVEFATTYDADDVEGVVGRLRSEARRLRVQGRERMAKTVEAQMAAIESAEVLLIHPQEKEALALLGEDSSEKEETP